MMDACQFDDIGWLAGVIEVDFKSANQLHAWLKAGCQNLGKSMQEQGFNTHIDQMLFCGLFVGIRGRLDDGWHGDGLFGNGFRACVQSGQYAFVSVC